MTTELVEIGFEGLRIECIIGVYPEERMTPQLVVFDLFATYDATRAVASDSESDALDYTLLGQVVRETAVAGKFGLLETLVYATVQRLDKEFPQIQGLELIVRKPGGMPGGDNSVARYRRKP